MGPASLGKWPFGPGFIFVKMSDPSISLSSLLVESREGSKVGKEWFCVLFTYANFGKMTEPKVLGVTAIIFRVNLPHFSSRIRFGKDAFPRLAFDRANMSSP